MSQNEPEKLPFAGPQFAKAWEEWIAYRRERKLPKYVPRGLKMTFTKLINDSFNDEKTAIAMIENAMANNYQGIHPINSRYGTGVKEGNSPTGKPGTSAARVDALRKW